MNAPQVRRIAVDGRELAVYESGRGAPVIAVHSGGFSARQWRKLAETLSATHHVLVPDLLGYGGSTPWPLGEPFLATQDLAALETLLDQLGAPAHLVGHSYGGLLAMKLALSRPTRVQSLALYEPVAFSVLDEPEDADARASLLLVQNEYRAGDSGADDVWLGQFVDWWNGAGAWARLAEDARASFRTVGWKVFQEVRSIGADRTPRPVWATIEAPTLLLGGERSPATERRVIEKLTRTLARAELRVFPGMGHMGPITHGAAVNAAIAAHVRAHP
jgi:pimeloyl-ACP methyl ester carboxylesterase